MRGQRAEERGNSELLHGSAESRGIWGCQDLVRIPGKGAGKRLMGLTNLGRQENLSPTEGGRVAGC